LWMYVGWASRENNSGAGVGELRSFRRRQAERDRYGLSAKT
jgi:hypothetical protein